MSDPFDLEAELVGVVDSLNAGKVPYALCGGLALAVHGRCARDEGTSLACDRTVGALGALCTGGGACSADGSTLLICQDGAYAVYQVCRGEQPGCEAAGTKMKCKNNDLAEIGDPCRAGDNACSLDGKALLKCSAGSYAVAAKCKSCGVKGDDLDCRH